MTPLKKNILWAMVQLIASVAGMWVFFIWAPWHAATALDKVQPSLVASFPTGCPAVVVNHGHYSCFEFGTIASNPWGFALCTGILVLIFALLLFTGLTGRGIYFLRMRVENKLTPSKEP